MTRADIVSEVFSGNTPYVLTARVSNTEAELSPRRRELSQVEHGMLENSVQAVSTDNGVDDRAHSVLDVAQLAERAARLKIEIRQLTEDSARYQEELDAYRGSHPPMS